MSLIFKNKKAMTLVGSFVTLAIVLVALLLAVSAAFPKSFGWFSQNDEVNAEGMSVVLDGGPFVLWVKNETGGHYAFAQSTTDTELSTVLPVVEGGTFDHTLAQSGLGTKGILFNLVPSEELTPSNTTGYTSENKLPEIQPGSSGVVEFYVEPKDDDLAAVSIDLCLRGWKETNSGISEIGAGDIDANGYDPLELLSGHILFFLEKSEATGKYSGFVDESFNYVFAEHAADKVGNKYLIRLYWVWASNFSQLVFADNENGWARHRALFAADENGHTTDLHDYIRDNPARFFQTELYNAVQLETEIDGANFSNDDVFLKWNEYYNNADQMVGVRVRYMLAQFEVNPAQPETNSAEP